jgi:uncharacterized protein (DUF58 family)
LPRDEHLDALLQGLGADAVTPRVGTGTEIAGLRNYQPGDPARSIHWKRTAALGEVLVLEKHRDASTHVAIALDNARPAGADARWERAFEHAISRAAGIVVASAGRDLSVEVICRGQRSPMLAAGSPPDILLRFLALLESVPATSAPPFAPVGRNAHVVEIPVALHAGDA